MLPQSEIETEYKYDLRETDSLVSPLVGTWVVDCVYPFDPEEHTAILFRIELQMNHAPHDEGWVLTSGKGTIIGGKIVKGNISSTRSFVERQEGDSFDFETLEELKYKLGIFNEYWRASRQD